MHHISSSSLTGYHFTDSLLATRIFAKKTFCWQMWFLNNMRFCIIMCETTLLKYSNSRIWYVHKLQVHCIALHCVELLKLLNDNWIWRLLVFELFGDNSIRFYDHLSNKSHNKNSHRYACASNCGVGGKPLYECGNVKKIPPKYNLISKQTKRWCS